MDSVLVNLPKIAFGSFFSVGSWSVITMYTNDEINFHNVSVRIVSLLSLVASKCDHVKRIVWRLVYNNETKCRDWV